MIWDMFTFFNELDILEIRLATLDPVVDKFVICESTVTHNGKPKPLLLQQSAHRLEPWANKIRHVVIEQCTDQSDRWNWQREKEQRALLWHGFNGSPGDLIILSDVDEIPNPEAITDAEVRHDYALGEIPEVQFERGPDYQGNILLCRMHVGKLNYRWVTPAHESHAVCRIFPAHLIGSKFQNLEEARLANMEPLGPPGWHLSWMDHQEEKLAAFAHPELLPYADIEGALEGKPLFPGVIHEEIEWCDLDELPPYVSDNKEKYAHMMVKEPAHV